MFDDDRVICYTRADDVVGGADEALGDLILLFS